MRKISLLLLAIGWSLAALAQPSHDKAIRKIEKLLGKELKKEKVSNVYLSIYSPSQQFEWHIAKGTFSDGSAVTTEHPYYAASVGKTFTAMAIGILADQGKLRFDDPITRHLSDVTMEGLHFIDGVDYRDSITVAHLLQHTSGLPDYFAEPTDGTTEMLDIIVNDPDQFWQPEELIAFSKAHFEPAFAPGADFYYTDTEYVLLGMIIERVSGMQLHTFFKRYFFEPLEMNHTCLNQRSRSIEPTLEIAEMYFGNHEISTLTSLSADWAGGAIVSTGKDLITFQAALMEGKLVSPETLQRMQDWVPETKGMAYGFGLRKITFNELAPILPAWEVIGHSGLNGTSMYYCPDLDIYIAGTLNQLEASRDAVVLMAKILMACKKL